jgi:hypothetical protein
LSCVRTLLIFWIFLQIQIYHALQSPWNIWLWFICYRSFYRVLITMFWSPHQLQTMDKGKQILILCFRAS